MKSKIYEEMKKQYQAVLEADINAVNPPERLPPMPPPLPKQGGEGLPPPPPEGEKPEGTGEEKPEGEDMDRMEDLADTSGGEDKIKLGKILKGIMGACKRAGVFVVSTDENATIKVDGNIFIVGIKAEGDEHFTSAYKPQ